MGKPKTGMTANMGPFPKNFELGGSSDVGTGMYNHLNVHYNIVLIYLTNVFDGDALPFDF
jgi:hypothetical protein